MLPRKEVPGRQQKAHASAAALVVFSLAAVAVLLSVTSSANAQGVRSKFGKPALLNPNWYDYANATGPNGRRLVKKHPDTLPCKSGTWNFAPPTLAIYEDQFVEGKTEFVANGNEFGNNVRVQKDGSVNMHLLRNAPGKAPKILPGVKGTYGPVYVAGGAVISSRRLLSHGKISTWLRPGPRAGPGVIFAFITMAANGDEIDIEWVPGSPWFDGAKIIPGNKNAEYAYYKGGIPWDAPNFYSYGGNFAIPKSDWQNNYHKYSIEWTAKFIKWYVDDILVAKVFKKDLKFEKLNNGTKYQQFPETFPNIQCGSSVLEILSLPDLPTNSLSCCFSDGIWDSGSSTSEGTRTWGGGFTDWRAPYNDTDGYYLNIKKISIQCYK